MTKYLRQNIKVKEIYLCLLIQKFYFKKTIINLITIVYKIKKHNNKIISTVVRL